MTSRWSLLANHRVHQAFFLALSATLFLAKLGGHGLASFDDCYYAQKAKEILQTGDWITIHHDGIVKFDNPPFFLWLLALSFKAFGVTEFAAKFPSALFGVASILLVYSAGRVLWNSSVGFVSAFVLCTTLPFIRLARHAMMDVVLSFFVSVALFSLLLAIRRHPAWFLLWGFAIALCIMMKSVLGLFPPLITVLFLAASGRWKVLLNPFFLLGGAIALSLGFAWHLHQFLHHGQAFLDVHFGWLILDRGIAGERQSWVSHLSYLEHLGTRYWPWLPLFLFGIVHVVKNRRRLGDVALLLPIWVALPILVMSMMLSRASWYILPIFPAAALICGVTLFERTSRVAISRFIGGAMALGVVAILVVHLTPVQLESNRQVEIKALAPQIKRYADKGASIIGYRIGNYWVLNNALLFYSDHSAAPLLEDPREVREAFQKDQLTLCLVRSVDFDRLLGQLGDAHVILSTGNQVLISNRDPARGEL